MAARADALRRALFDGHVDSVAGDHAPHTAEEKAGGACGLIGLETTLGLVLTHLVGNGKLSVAGAAGLLSRAPARIFRLPGGTLGEAARSVFLVPDIFRLCKSLIIKHLRRPFGSGGDK